MSSSQRPQAGLTQDALQAGPLCPRVPVLSVLELASRDARRRPLLLPAEEPGDCAATRAHFDEVRRHVHEERCPTCQRWYRNATAAYFDGLKRKLRPFARRPRKLAAGPEHLAYGLAARGAGLGALEGLLIWRRLAALGGWGLRVQFRPACPGEACDLAAFDAVGLEVYFEVPGRDGPMRLATRLELEGEGLLTSPEEFVDLDHPDRVRRVTIRPQAPLGALDLS